MRYLKRHLSAGLAVVLLSSVCLAQNNAIKKIDNFGANPGNIKMYTYLPEGVPDNAPLVVSLHGCRQTAEIYSNAGWKDQADRWKFYVLFPEQQKENNDLLCWSWFLKEDFLERQGEAASILNMINKMKESHSIDESRIFIEGLSAGAWMAAAMLAAYPEVFAGGAVIAGGPSYCGCTERSPWDYFYFFFYDWAYQQRAGLHAMACMEGFDKSPDQWASLVEKYTPYSGPWPRLSVWRGTGDTVVKPINSRELIEQWSALDHITPPPEPASEPLPQGGVREIYKTNSGEPLIELYTIEGMGHGIPISQHDCGKASKYVLDKGICAVEQIARFWGIDR